MGKDDTNLETDRADRIELKHSALAVAACAALGAL